MNLLDAAIVLCNQRHQHSLPASLEGGQCTSFVLLHEARVPNDIGGQDGSKAALGTRLGHGVAGPLEVQEALIVLEFFPRV